MAGRFVGAALALVMAVAGWLSVSAVEAPSIPPDGEQAEAVTPRGPILLHGNADFCDDEDRDGAIGLDDGIINCDVADGSAARPYLISGWRIVLDPAPTCGTSSGSTCALPALPQTCRSQEFRGLVVLCETTRHVILRNLELVVRSVDYDAVALYMAQASNVHIEATSVLTRAGAILAWSSGDEPAGPVTVQGVTIAADATTPSDPRDYQRSQPAVHFSHVSGRLSDVSVDATGHDVGILVEGGSGDLGARPEVVIEDSLIQNAAVQGILSRASVVHILSNVLRDNAQPGQATKELPTEAGAGALHLASLVLWDTAFLVAENRILGAGPAIVVRSAEPGRLAQNVLLADPNDPSPSRQVGLRVLGTEPCPFQSFYNEFGIMRIVNENPNPACVVDVRFNWWASVSGPAMGAGQVSQQQIAGLNKYRPWINATLDRLPRARIFGPAVIPEAYSRIALTGNAQAAPNETVHAVQAAASEDDWSQPADAEGTTAWNYSWDVSTLLPGPNRLWVRACDAAGCGIPASVEANVVTAPFSPLAVLEVAPRVVRVGDPVLLDAGLSYSTQNRPIVAYRFSAGDGRDFDWQSDPKLLIEYATPGAWTAKAAVRDALGAESANLGEVTVRVLAPEEAPRALGATPGLAAWATLVALAGLVVGRRGA